MARSKRVVKKQDTSLSGLLEALPESFLAPVVTEDVIGSLRGYLSDLEDWVGSQGVPQADVRSVALDIMNEIRSEERRVGKEWSTEGARTQKKDKSTT